MIIELSATREPIRYEPLSPKKILALGKLNKIKESKIIIWAIKNIANSLFPLEIFKKSKIVFIAIKLIVIKPLKPSIKFEPLIINKKHKTTKIDEKNLICKKDSKKGCNNKNVKCITHNLWDELETHINNFFEKKKLEDLVNKDKKI